MSTVRTRRCDVYCIDCGGRLTYYPKLSAPRNRDARILVYGCADCSKKHGKPVMIAVQRCNAADPRGTLDARMGQHRRVRESRAKQAKEAPQR